MSDNLFANANSYLSVEQLLPNGKREGKNWVALNPTRSDTKLGSFKVNVETGQWADFATGDKGGDLVSLYSYLHNISSGDAAKEILSRNKGAPPAKKKPPSKEKPKAIVPIPEDKLVEGKQFCKKRSVCEQKFR